MVSEILLEMENNLKVMEDLIRNQKFHIVDAYRYLERYLNIYNRMEELIISRDKWKKKAQNYSNKKQMDLIASRDKWRKKYLDLKKECKK